MTTADGWTRAVRAQVGLGRLLPLGGPRDGAWITEDAAATVLRAAGREVPGVRLGRLRVGPAEATDAADEAGAGREEAGPEAYGPVIPVPPSGLPPGPLRVSAECAAGPAEPLPMAAARLRAVLAAAAAERLGLTVTEVDVRVTTLLDEDPAPEPAPEPGREREAARLDVPDGGDEARVALVALDVPGVSGLTGRLGGLGRAVHLEYPRPGETREAAALPRRHARVELSLRPGHRAVDVARQVRAAVSEALTDHPTVAVVITAIG
ncbi:nucleopolyhedrovirus P10 family protein [Streptomyces longwoodensis]|uniref:nucleopolyhedrovirus P10 family protein n=1 Tax=Streptomyces longwoodensis TaxID=68231 RepID=UPI00225B6597|nr:nucleopolyhedrovirus P10 family protein [Streptomyces longwoodensis]MCX4999062.1 nucleopolyhedrovirus P10 family protein [Streptomyces longwoodensis]